LGRTSRVGAVKTGDDSIGALVGAVSALHEDAAAGASVCVEGVSGWGSTIFHVAQYRRVFPSGIRERFFFFLKRNGFTPRYYSNIGNK